ncbi:cytoplasmic aspartate aminotransferase, putative [Candida dubliniensis CD36]|uniref:Aspartate aminotransferase n=1 Tax=Candida dubliniensis (strain CD36 / ATCC MYA-646 / CBS 7987 / NCPF 3949 / NRRL Y-17841) TaxID=573826 RepID=B9WFI3_CANDC|nr:cytoplasmic aspartate aminotransferase, putative [Candida dubliniensis CD36]CAX42002.1 cytoplasmic aspartate aminotransferase, putative [Candida dubliniensis CD36]
MTIKSKFTHLTKEEPDPIIKTLTQYQQDQSPNKLDVSIGIYKSSDGSLYTFPSINQAKEIYHNEKNYGHNYTTMSGIKEFINGSKQLLFGEIYKKNIASIQTIAGTGAIHMGLLFFKEAGYKNFYVGLPTWSNYIPMIKQINGEINTYEYYNNNNDNDGGINFNEIKQTLEKAPKNSVFIFQTCCHNPTGADFNQQQWIEIIKLIKQYDHLILMDTAYLGFSSGDLIKDSWILRYMYDNQIEFVVAQSFSKNMGLYGERLGALHVIIQDENYIDHIQSTLINNFRQECSFAPSFPARLAQIIFENEKLYLQWIKEINQVTKRLKNLRQLIYKNLINLKTPGNWQTVIQQNGLFWYSGLTPQQNQRLISHHNVYSTSIGRVNIAGLNEQNVEYFCKAIDEVVRYNYD